MTTSLVRRPDIFGRLADWLEMPEFGRFADGPRFAEMIKIEQKAVDGKLEIRAEMPGIDPEKDVDISIVDDVLTIKAERREEEKGEREGASFSEFRYGSFMRSLRVPKGTSVKDVKASYKDGILTILVPTPVEVKPEAFKVPVSRN
ncbi:MAG TPA: Hsp20/alpha crystallin family protein [Ilumatobacteraceae bacterium]|nr:Hsp20/alpha crystallin family protein [Ilumatobacteraceae bacterium]